MNVVIEKDSGMELEDSCQGNTSFDDIFRNVIRETNFGTQICFHVAGMFPLFFLGTVIV